VLLGGANASLVNVDDLQRRLDRPEYSGVAASLGETGFHSAVDLLATYAGRASDLAPMLAHARINEDLNMRLQYIAGLGLNSVTSPRVYREVLSYRRFPEELFAGSGESMDALHELIGRPHRVF
jgi:spermidine synthase